MGWGHLSLYLKSKHYTVLKTKPVQIETTQPNPLLSALAFCQFYGDLDCKWSKNKICMTDIHFSISYTRCLPALRFPKGWSPILCTKYLGLRLMSVLSVPRLYWLLNIFDVSPGSYKTLFWILGSENKTKQNKCTTTWWKFYTFRSLETCKFFLNVGSVISILNLTVGKKSVTSFVTCN